MKEGVSMTNKKIITAIAAVSLISVTGIGVVSKMATNVSANRHAKITRRRPNKKDNRVYIIQVAKNNTFAYFTPSTKHKRGSIYLPKRTRLHVYNTVKTHNQTFYEIKSHRYVPASDIKIIE